METRSKADIKTESQDDPIFDVCESCEGFGKICDTCGDIPTRCECGVEQVLDGWDECAGNGVYEIEEYAELESGRGR